MYHESTMSSPLDGSTTAAPPHWSERWLRQAVLQRLAKLEYGSLTLVDSEGTQVFGCAAPGRITGTGSDFRPVAAQLSAALLALAALYRRLWP